MNTAFPCHVHPQASGQGHRHRIQVFRLLVPRSNSTDKALDGYFSSTYSEGQIGFDVDFDVARLVERRLKSHPTWVYSHIKQTQPGQSVLLQ